MWVYLPYKDPMGMINSGLSHFHISQQIRDGFLRRFWKFVAIQCGERNLPEIQWEKHMFVSVYHIQDWPWKTVCKEFKPQTITVCGLNSLPTVFKWFDSKYQPYHNHYQPSLTIMHDVLASVILRVTAAIAWEDHRMILGSWKSSEISLCNELFDVIWIWFTLCYLIFIGPHTYVTLFV